MILKKEMIKKQAKENREELNINISIQKNMQVAKNKYKQI